MNRREFIAGAGAAIVARGASAAEGGSKPLCAVMPPGALSLSRFSRSCTACGLCISSCPEKALAHAGLLDYGLGGWMLPKLDFAKGACDPSCSRCAEVCPARALARRTGEVVKVGLAEWSRENCRTTKGDTCTLCSERCPTDDYRRRICGGVASAGAEASCDRNASGSAHSRALRVEVRRVRKVRELLSGRAQGNQGGGVGSTGENLCHQTSRNAYILMVNLLH